MASVTGTKPVLTGCAAAGSALSNVNIMMEGKFLRYLHIVRDRRSFCYLSTVMTILPKNDPFLM